MGKLGFCCCPCVGYFEHELTPMCVDSVEYRDECGFKTVHGNLSNSN